MSIKAVSFGGRSDIKKITLGGGVLFEKQASVVFNQLIPNPTFADTSFWKYKKTYAFTVSDNVGRFVCNTATAGTNDVAVRANAPVDVLVGRSYYFGFSAKLPKGTAGRIFYAVNDGIASNVIWINYTAGQWTRFEGILTINEKNAGDTGYTGYSHATGFWVPLKGNTGAAVGDEYLLRDAMVVDLTAMYGAGNEPTLAAFRAAYPLDSYPYTPLQ